MRNPIVGVVFGLFVACFVLAGCAVATLPFPPHLTDHGAAKTPVELQAIQTREFETDKARLMSVFITVFQDQGYSIDNTELASGFIAAKMPSEMRLLSVREFNPNTPLKFDFQNNISSGFSLRTDRSINVLVNEISPNRSTVRVSINLKLGISPGTFAPHQGLETNPDQYQAIFSKVQQGLFLKKNLE